MSPEQLIAEARSWIGTPFQHGASLKGQGCDCAGFVLGVWRACGCVVPNVPAYTSNWPFQGRDPLLEHAQHHVWHIEPEQRAAGDVLFFRWRPHEPVGHVALATSPFTMIHAHEGACVTEVHIHPAWLRRLVAAGRPLHL